jgi:hypothetical protein
MAGNVDPKDATSVRDASLIPTCAAQPIQVTGGFCVPLRELGIFLSATIDSCKRRMLYRAGEKMQYPSLPLKSGRVLLIHALAPFAALCFFTSALGSFVTDTRFHGGLRFRFKAFPLRFARERGNEARRGEKLIFVPLTLSLCESPMASSAPTPVFRIKPAYYLLLCVGCFLWGVLLLGGLYWIISF